MIIDNPRPSDVPVLRKIWQEAFADTEEFLDDFFQVGFAYDRCWCVYQEHQPVAAVYLFECGWQEKRVAYLYALAVAHSHQKQGLSRLLLTDVHAKLRQAGYAGVIMEPASESLREYYKRLGYRPFGGRRTVEYSAGELPCSITELAELAYGQLRRRLLPRGGITQEGAFAALLQRQAVCYGGDGFVAAVSRREPIVLEFLGDESKIPAFLKALHWKQASVRIVGDMPTAVYLDFYDQDELPSYFGLPLD